MRAPGCANWLQFPADQLEKGTPMKGTPMKIAYSAVLGAAWRRRALPNQRRGLARVRRTTRKSAWRAMATSEPFPAMAAS